METHKKAIIVVDNSLDRISEEIGGESCTMINKTNKSNVKSIFDVNKDKAPEFIDIDQEEKDKLYLQNSFNFHSNAPSFWKNCIINQLKLVQKN